MGPVSFKYVQYAFKREGQDTVWENMCLFRRKEGKIHQNNGRDPSRCVHDPDRCLRNHSGSGHMTSSRTCTDGNKRGEFLPQTVSEKTQRLGDIRTRLFTDPPSLLCLLLMPQVSAAAN